MFRSIRVTLLFWFAVILLAATATLGAVLHNELRSTLYREADAQLAQWIDALNAASHLEMKLTLPATARFGVFDAAGRRTAASADFTSTKPPQNAETVTRDDHRWTTAPGTEKGSWIVVGRSVRDENHRIRRFLIVLLSTGVAVTALALLGGYMLFSRALAPAHTIAQTATRISGDNLGERIDVSRVPRELTGLATTLNSSFERLQQAFDQQLRFTADASHELRTPLAVTLAHLDLALASEQSAEQLRERIHVCRESTLRMQVLVTQLLQLARSDAGEALLARTPVDTAQLAHEVTAAMGALADERGITLTCEATPVTVVGDTERLREVLTNLIDNAIRYNKPGGRVQVQLTRTDAEARIVVADTGIGIDPEHRDRVFERFYRVDPARSGEASGNGLGLAITRVIVQQHGGSISLESAAPEGCRLVVRLPLQAQPT